MYSDNDTFTQNMCKLYTQMYPPAYDISTRPPFAL